MEKQQFKINDNVEIVRSFDLSFLKTQYIDYQTRGVVVELNEEHIYKYLVEFNTKAGRRLIRFKRNELYKVDVFSPTKDHTHFKTNDLNKKGSISEYQKLSKRTLNTDLDREQMLCNMAFGLTGESGEVIDILKKHLHQGHVLDKDHMMEELGDVMFYIVNLCNVLNINMVEVLEGNINKLEKRYPNGFDVEKSVKRND